MRMWMRIKDVQLRNRKRIDDIMRDLEWKTCKTGCADMDIYRGCMKEIG